MPEAVTDIVAIGSTTNMSVSWRPAVGQVDSYTVLLYRSSQLETNRTGLSNTTVNTLFLDLKPGVLYCVKVITKSGPLDSNTSSVSNATCESPSWLIGPLFIHYICTVCILTSSNFSNACSLVVLCSVIEHKWNSVLSLVQFPTLLASSLWSRRLWSPSTLPGAFQRTWTIISTTSMCSALMALLTPQTTGSCCPISSLELATISLLLL